MSIITFATLQARAALVGCELVRSEAQPARVYGLMPLGGMPYWLASEYEVHVELKRLENTKERAHA